jgi:hypothetical protein
VTPAPPFRRLPFGAVRPEGWLLRQMRRDLADGFAGRLDGLCEEASSDIFVTSRNSRRAANTRNRDGVPWWNGETEGNWRAGHSMLAGLTGDADAMAQADAYARHILASQDADGYLGAFAPDLRYAQEGELWTQACLLRGLVAWAELTGSAGTLQAVERAARCTMRAIGAGHAGYPWREHHDLMFVDVLQSLHEHTGDPAFPAFGFWLYDTWNAVVPRTDSSLTTLLDPSARWTDHGVHTYEILRVPTWLGTTSGRADLARAAAQAVRTLERYTLPSGAAVSQEWIEDAMPHPSEARYETCALKELLVSLQSAYAAGGDAALGDRIERLFFNAVQGARLPDGRGVNYLARDSRDRCTGIDPRDGKRKEKFSPTHADAAVCCPPNAAQIAAHYVRGCWMHHPAGGLAAMTHGPCTVRVPVQGVPVQVTAHTAYPFDRTVTLEVRPGAPVEFPLWLRDPGWSGATVVDAAGARVERRDGFIRVEKCWVAGDRVEIVCAPRVRVETAVNGEVALAHGALLYAEPLPSREVVLREYSGGFRDAEYEAVPLPPALSLPVGERSRAFGFVQERGGAVAEAGFDAPVAVLTGSALDIAGDRQPLTLVPFGAACFTRRLTRPVR